MNIFSTLSAQVSRIAGSLRATARQVYTRVFARNSPEVYPDISGKNAIDKGFNFNTAVYSIIMKGARKFGSVPRYVYNKDQYEEKSKKLKQLPIHPIIAEYKAYTPYVDKRPSALAPSLTELLKRPNEYISEDLFYEALFCYYKTTGEAMIWLNRGDLNAYRQEDGSFNDSAIDKLPVLEMYVLPPDKVTIIPDPYNLWGLLGYILEVGERVHMRKADVIHWKSTNLNFSEDTRDHLRGWPALRSGKKSLEMNNSMTDASVRMAQNDGARFVLYNETMGAMSPQQQTDLKAVIDRKINNNDVKSAVATLQGKWGGIDLGKSATDMELLDGKKFSWQELCFLFDVPFEFFDPHTPFAEKQMAMLNWITNSMEPLTKQLDGEMNRQLLIAFGLQDKAFIGCDYMGLPEMKQLATDTAKKLQDIWSVTPNEVRETMGYEAFADERFNEPWVPGDRVPVSELADGASDEDILKQLEGAYGKVGANGNGN